MNQITDIDNRLRRVHTEIIELVVIITDFMETRLGSNEEQYTLNRLVNNFEVCRKEMSILRDMLSVKATTERIIGNMEKE